MNKDKVIDTVNELPQNFELDELMEKLIFIEKVEAGLQQVEQGKVVSNEKAKEIAKQW
jgi:predicted transcriptional regulator